MILGIYVLRLAILDSGKLDEFRQAVNRRVDEFRSLLVDKRHGISVTFLQSSAAIDGIVTQLTAIVETGGTLKKKPEEARTVEQEELEPEVYLREVPQA